MDIKVDTRFYYMMHHWKVYITKAIALDGRIQFRFLLRKVGAVRIPHDWKWINAEDVRVVSISNGLIHIVPKEEISDACS